MKKVFWAVGFLGLLVSLYVGMGANTKTATLAISAVVPSHVEIITTPVDFGALSITNPTMAAGQIQINGVEGMVNIRVALSAGNYATSTRNLAESPTSEKIPYELYSDSARTIIWGDADFGNTYPLGQAMGPFEGGSMGWVTLPVYGTASAVPWGQYTSEDATFQDAVTVTVIW